MYIQCYIYCTHHLHVYTSKRKASAGPAEAAWAEATTSACQVFLEKAFGAKVAREPVAESLAESLKLLKALFLASFSGGQVNSCSKSVVSRDLMPLRHSPQPEKYLL